MSANAYISVSDVTTGLGNQAYELLDVAVGSDVSANTALLAKIEETNAQVDSYLRGRYSLPLAVVSADLKMAAMGLVRWGLLMRRPEVASEGDRSIFEDARKYLSDVSKGIVVLDTGAPEGTSEASLATVVQVGSNVTAQSDLQTLMEGY